MATQTTATNELNQAWEDLQNTPSYAERPMSYQEARAIERRVQNMQRQTIDNPGFDLSLQWCLSCQQQVHGDPEQHVCNTDEQLIETLYNSLTSAA